MPDLRKIHGALAEDIAVGFLRLQGYDILQRNAHVHKVEVDIVARRNQTLVLVEVKLRRSSMIPLEASLRGPQLRRLQRAASVLLVRHAWADETRIDWIGVLHLDNRLALQHLESVAPW